MPTNSISETRNWDWIYKFKRKSLCSLLYRIIDRSSRQILHFYESERTSSVFFPSKFLNYTSINLFRQKLSNFTIVNFNTSTRKVITLHTSAKQFSVNAVCSSFKPDCRYNTNNFELLGNVRSSNENSSGVPCVHKIFFGLPAEAPLNDLNASGAQK